MKRGPWGKCPSRVFDSSWYGGDIANYEIAGLSDRSDCHVKRVTSQVG